MALTLITGPVRSGKSRFAELLATQSALPVTYVATARPDPADLEWAERLSRHQERRPSGWQLIETARHDGSLPEVLTHCQPDQCVLVDSLGTWLADQMLPDDAHEGSLGTQSRLDKQTVQLLDSIRSCAAELILVGEETGWGVVPAYPMGRCFRDRLGKLQQDLAPLTQACYLVVSGYALDLKKLGISVNAPVASGP
ncbi:MAG: bifunctional adenosylcobinamide kinase/adenosylcobinamide-phosphate guanylyltransferase [Gemmatimonadaceae bacterium]|nr:bifunctional adenosylcobinamide kinase/adenosylcobinamide-phosphate guanylyltransferase [Gloeobacterales cyanobacterium ES-bin-141]